MQTRPGSVAGYRSSRSSRIHRSNLLAAAQLALGDLDLPALGGKNLSLLQEAVSELLKRPLN